MKSIFIDVNNNIIDEIFQLTPSNNIDSKLNNIISLEDYKESKSSDKASKKKSKKKSNKVDNKLKILRISRLNK